nr:hypothetical protein GCM10020092_016590 [Actinoplanes digitatis]
MTFYVTTAIPYVNAAPHLGHALELVQADVLARHRRLRGEDVRFLTGTDDNALKNVTAARATGVDVAAFVKANGDRFADLRGPLDLSFDDFIRTGSDPRHAPGVTALWRRSAADFYRREYTGRYCAGCERFLDGAACPEHPAAPETVAETNWFFRLSRYQRRILDVLESGRVRVEPAPRRNEVLAFVRAGLRDISVSRPAARAGGWGIPVPGDPDQVIYVWWDALANYVTALGDDAAYRRWWASSTERVHVIGKGIVRFHAVYWLALLLSAGLPLPTAIFVHDYLTVDGAKLSKSAGNAVDPVALAEPVRRGRAAVVVAARDGDRRRHGLHRAAADRARRPGPGGRRRQPGQPHADAGTPARRGARRGRLRPRRARQRRAGPGGFPRGDRRRVGRGRPRQPADRGAAALETGRPRAGPGRAARHLPGARRRAAPVHTLGRRTPVGAAPLRRAAAARLPATGRGALRPGR